MYDKAAQLWQRLYLTMEEELNKEGIAMGLDDMAYDVNDKDVKHYRLKKQTARGRYWGCHQRFFKSLCMGLKVPTLVAVAKKALADGHCVVIGLQSTGEAMAGRIVEENGESAPDQMR